MKVLKISFGTAILKHIKIVSMRIINTVTRRVLKKTEQHRT
jgi:hypothetical protein